MNVLKIIIPIVLVALVMNVNAQSMPDSIVKRNADGVAVSRSIFGYDKNRYQVLAMHYNFNKKTGKWTGTYREKARYSSDGNCVFKSMAYWDDLCNDWLEMTQESTDFDSQGRILCLDIKDYNRARSMWIGTTHLLYKYNADGILMTEQSSEWNDDNNEWQNKTEIEYVYDSEGRTVNCVERKWINGVWQNMIKHNYYYDEYGFKEKVVDETFGDGVWSKSQQTLISSMTSKEGNVSTVRMLQKYDASTGIFADFERYTRIVDSHFNEIALKSEILKNGEWFIIKNERVLLDYDANGNKIFEESFKWEGANNWIGNTKTEWVYDNRGLMLKELVMTWDRDPKVWKGITNIIYAYDEVGNKTSETLYKWAADTRSWVVSSKTEYGYDADRHKISEVSYSWNKVTKAWVEFFRGKYEYEFAKDGSVKQIKEYIWDSKRWRSKMTTQYYYGNN